MNRLFCLVALASAFALSWETTFAGVLPDPNSALIPDSTEEYYDPTHMRYDNYVYKENIQTVLLHREGFELSAPIMELGSDQTLHLEFDDLNDEYKDYSFELIHCGANWQPSDLMKMEYITGLPSDYINNYGVSRNTLQWFTHYNLYFPYNGMEITRSGNYIVKVFQDDDPENLVLTWRFMVVEQRIQIDGNVRAASSVQEHFTHQEVDFSLTSTSDYALTNPYQDVHVVVMQNQRWDNALTTLEPRFVKDIELDYDFDGENQFPGGNEYRYFDTRNLNFMGQEMDSVRFSKQDRLEHAWLDPSKRRSSMVYLDREDINGKRLIKKEGFANSELDADYVWIHFTLPVDAPVTGGDLYVFGALTDWRMTNRNKMRLNRLKGVYEVELFLKQGYYNFEYVFLPDGQREAQVATIEGSHYQTENEYTVLVYHRSSGDIYDRLVGVRTFHYNR